MTVAVVVALVVLVAAILVATSEQAPPAAGRARGERLEEALVTDRRLDAAQAAKANGTLGQTEPIVLAAAAGWTGEALIHPTADDWEPAIAADPSSSYVYMLVTRYTGPTACGSQCPLPYMMLKVSSDGGATWGPDRFICECRRVGAQADPIIEVVPSTGHVYAAWMDGYDTKFSKSTDHGATWSTPVKIYGKVSWTDKPILAMSDNGQNVYIAFNGPSGGDAYISRSTNAGGTWTQAKVIDSTRYYFAFDGDVLPNGTVVFSQASISYTGPGSAPEGVVQYHAIRSTNAGVSWSNVLIDSFQIGADCVAAGCSADYYLGHTAVSADASGNLVYLHDGALAADGPQTVWARTSTDGGATWTNEIALSTSGINSSFPAVESRGSGDVRAYYMQADGGPDAWNVWYRSSTNGGATWTAPVKISDATSGTAYKSAAGFKEPYGDYGEIAITNGGKTIAIWGEGDSYTGPGGVWFNRQT
jgi:Neuraminidase (sialidase)